MMRLDARESCGTPETGGRAVRSHPVVLRVVRPDLRLGGRVLGSLGVLLGISGVIGFLEMHYMWLALLTGSIVVFGITARYAVRQDREMVMLRASENGRNLGRHTEGC